MTTARPRRAPGRALSRRPLRRALSRRTLRRALSRRTLRHGTSRRPLQVLLAVVALAVLGGCGIGVDGQPAVLPQSQLPAALQYSTNSEPTKQKPAPPCGPTCVSVYVVNPTTGDLVQLVRQLPHRLSLQSALDELVKAPSLSEEIAFGYTTYVGTTPLTVSQPQTNGVVTVELDPDIASLYGYEYWHALGQIVWTLDNPVEFPLVKAVRFLYAGSPFEAQLPGGILTPSPVTRLSYSTIAPQSS